MYETWFWTATGGLPEQRFFHMQEEVDGTDGGRVLFETRLTGADGAAVGQVRKTPCRPRSRAASRLLYLYSHRNAWATLHISGKTNTFLAAGVRPLGLGGQLVRRLLRADGGPRLPAIRGGVQAPARVRAGSLVQLHHHGM